MAKNHVLNQSITHSSSLFDPPETEEQALQKNLFNVFSLKLLQSTADNYLKFNPTYLEANQKE